MAAEELRRHNLGAVIERVHLTGPHSRSELAALTGLNRSTVADLIAELSSLGLVEETPAEAAVGPGRPSPLVRIRPEGAVFLAIEISVDSIALATMGLGGHVFGETRVERRRGRFSPEETVGDLASYAGPLLDSLPPNRVLAGVGTALAGVTRRSDGFVHIAPNLGWHEVPLSEMLSRSLDVRAPLWVANEADLGALGEHRRGAGVGVDHLIYISGEVGIGAGIIYAGRPMLGAAGYAGEAGHTVVNPGGLRCRCGATGCWETEVGEAAFARRLGLAGDVTGREIVEMLIERLAAGDSHARKAVDEVGHWLGLGIGNLVNLLNPEVVVLGGFYHTLMPHIETAIRDGLGQSALRAPAGLAEIKPAGLGIDSPLFGAAEMAMSELIADPAGTIKALVGGRVSAESGVQAGVSRQRELPRSPSDWQ